MARLTRRKIDTLIVDLDNTLFDWLALWHGTFVVTLHELAMLFGTSEAEAAIRRVHQSRRTSEFRFLIDELLANRGTEAAQIRQRIEQTLAKSNVTRGAKPYAGVREGLADIKAAGTKVVACTESMEFYSVKRLHDLGLDGWIDMLFCNEDHSTPFLRSTTELAEKAPVLQSTFIRHIGIGMSKPDPRIIRDLLAVTGAEAERTAYVGDSLARDVVMARRAGVTDIHAAYGETAGRPEFELLSRVSHWTDADIIRENAASREARRVAPSITLRSDFREIFDFLQFERFGGYVNPNPNVLAAGK